MRATGVPPRQAGKRWRDVHFRRGGNEERRGTTLALRRAIAASHDLIPQVHMRRSLIAVAALSLSAWVITGCVIVDPSCSGGGGASIFISPSVVVIAVGQTTRPSASWCRGGRYDRVSPNWSLGQAADANIINVDTITGAITGKRAGKASVVATYEGAQGSRVEVTVQ